jgi:UDP-N-acetylglucosamine acyltransferase
MARGNRANLCGLNVVGLKRRGFTHEQISALREAYAAVFTGPATLAERMAHFIAGCVPDGPLAELAAFLRADSRRPLCLPGKAGHDDDGGD